MPWAPGRRTSICRPPRPRPWSSIRPRCWCCREITWRPTTWACCWPAAATMPRRESALEHGVLISRQAASLYNLSVVYQQLGQPRWAELARQQAERLRQAEAARLRARQISVDGAVQWMDPRQFAQTGVEGPVPPPAAPPRPAPATLPATSPARQSSDAAEPRGKIVLCQALGPAAPYDICGVDGGTPCSATLGRRPADQLAGLCTGRIHRPREAPARARVSLPR